MTRVPRMKNNYLVLNIEVLFMIQSEQNLLISVVQQGN